MTTTFLRGVLTFCIVALGVPWARTAVAEASGIGRQAHLDLAQASVYFEPNVGQADPSVRFVGRAARYSMLLEEHAMTFMGTPSAGSESNHVLDWMRFEFGGCEKDSDAFASGRLPGKSNYFMGNDPNRWHADVAHYTRVDISEICPGIAVSYHGKGSNVEYDLTVAPGADPAKARIDISGTRRVEFSAAGELVLIGSNGEIRHSRPVAYQVRDGVRSTVAAAYKLLGEQGFSFDVGPYDHKLPLVIDPVIVYSTYLGGPAQGIGSAIAVDGNGSAYVTGETYSLAFPLKNPIYAIAHGDLDVTVSKFDPSGSTLVYSTYLGSSSFDLSRSIAVDAAGNVYVAGMTGALDFPTANAFQSNFGGNTDAFVTKISPTGSSLVYSTFLGGSGSEDGSGIAVDAAGSVFVTGQTKSADFPVLNAYQGTFHGTVISADAFLAKLDPTGTSLQFSTFFGGSADDISRAIVVDALGGAWIGGSTASSDLPILNGFQTQFAGLNQSQADGIDGFLAHFSNSGLLLYSSFIGGTHFDAIHSLAMHPSGDVVLFGETASWPDFPAVLPVLNGFNGAESFIARVNPTTGLVFSSLFPGDGAFSGGVAVNPAGETLVVGAASSDFPVATELAGDALQNNAIYLAKVASDGSHLVYSTFLGYSTQQQNGWGIALDPAGAIYIMGDANQGIPIVNAFQSSSGGYQNYAVAKLTDSETCSFSVSPTSFTVPPAGGSGLITVTTGSNCFWNKYAFNFASSVQGSDAGTNDSSGFLVKGSGTVSFQLSTTDLGPDVTSTALVAGRTVSVTQTGWGCNYAVDPGPAFFTAAGGPSSLGTSALPGCKATASSNVNWISIPSPNINGGGSVAYNVQPNAGPARTGTISLAALTYTVNQAAPCNSSFDSAGQDFPRIGGGGTVHVLAPSDCAWSITNDNAGTLNISSPFPPSGTGNATIVFSASDNNFQVPQVAHLRLSSGATFTVTVAGPCLTTSILVNAGGPAYTDSACNPWSADTGFLQGSSYSTTAAITGTNDPALYQTEHYSTGNLTYQTSVPNGSYTVTLKFAELYWASSGQRVFNVQLNGTQAATNLDVFAAAGGMNKAYDVSYPVTVSGGQITITLVAVTGFPAVNAIEIVPSAPPTPDFAVTATPTSQTLAPGVSTTYAVATAAMAGFSGTVSLSLSGLPAGATASFNPFTLTGSGSTTLTVNTTSGTPLGSYPLIVIAVSGSLSHTATVTLVVSDGIIRVNAGGPGYTDSQSQTWSPDSGFLQGASYSSTAAIIGTNDPALYQTEHYSTGNLTYQATVPNGSYNVTLRFAELYWTSPGQRIFKILMNGTQYGPDIDVFAASGGMNKAWAATGGVTVTGGQLNITLVPVVGYPAVNAIEIAPFAAVPDFTVAADPPFQAIAPGGSTAYTVNIAAVDGFSGTVSFGVTGLPGGVSASFNPSTISGSGSTTMTVVTGSGTPAGSTPLTVTATSGPLNHTAVVALVVNNGAVRVNSGGPTYTDSLSQIWSADAGFLQGSSYSTTAGITGTGDPALYQSEHYNTGNLTYQTSVPNGGYTVKLKFAELYWNSPGQRVFNILVNGAQVATGLDIFAIAGGINKALDLSYSLTVTGGQITITLGAVTGYPAVNAIEITPTGPPTPDFTVTATPPSQTLTPAGSTTYTVTTTAVAGFSGTVGFSLSGLPAGATASFNPPTVTGSGSTSLTVNTTSGTPAGSSPLTVTATSASLTHTAAATLMVSNGAVRVNAGGSAYTDSQSQVWLADTGFLQGSSYSTTAAITGTNDPALYQTEHYSTGNLTYQTSVPNGSYTVTLKFAELYWASSGQRVFNVQLNGTQVATNVDVFAAAGGMNKAYDVSYPVTVNGGQITITLVAVTGFPAVNAIEAQ